MARRDSGPRRTESVDAYLWGTRALAALALLALVGGVLSDALAGDFWARHALLAGLASSVIIVMLTVALVNEAVERRSRQRWSVLAQYVMLQLVRDARLVWTGVAGLAGLMPAGERPVDEGSAAVRDTAGLTSALRGVVGDEDKKQKLRAEIAAFVEHNDAVLGRWAAVMLNADAYAEVLDRHVELAGDLTWLSSLLERESSEHDTQARRRRMSPRPPRGRGGARPALADKFVPARPLLALTGQSWELRAPQLERHDAIRRTVSRRPTAIAPSSIARSRRSRVRS
jgi:hypothetical protein